MAKKLLYKATLSLQLLLLMAAFGVQYFSEKKMGMMRYMVFTNRQLQEQYPVAAIQHYAIALLACMTLISMAVYGAMRIKKAASTKSLKMLILLAVISVSAIVFILGFTPESCLSYFFTGPVLVLTALIQEINFLVYLKR